MRFLVVGLGSMGKRRIRNLQELGFNKIVGFDIRKDRTKQILELYSIDVEEDFDSAIAKKLPSSNPMFILPSLE